MPRLTWPTRRRPRSWAYRLHHEGGFFFRCCECRRFYRLRLLCNGQLSDYYVLTADVSPTATLYYNGWCYTVGPISPLDAQSIVLAKNQFSTTTQCCGSTHPGKPPASITVTFAGITKMTGCTVLPDWDRDVGFPASALPTGSFTSINLNQSFTLMPVPLHPCTRFEYQQEAYGIIYLDDPGCPNQPPVTCEIPARRYVTDLFIYVRPITTGGYTIVATFGNDSSWTPPDGCFYPVGNPTNFVFFRGYFLGFSCTQNAPAVVANEITYHEGLLTFGEYAAYGYGGTATITVNPASP
jgi:hypothetical protein